MQNLKFDQDIKPLSEVRNGMAAFIKQIHETKRPLIITQRGKSAAVLLDVHEYELMQEKLNLLTDIRTSLNQLNKGEGISHENARKELRGRIES
ncbi:MAG: type II toxin-antitoxin system Phd/YefM family antitoxin [Desulfobacteraceae bacterium]|nr:type II toxin-antitoxin system Phd/YefM family antitoxin [Desulfobacteraceae bacterium]